ncbi:predicted protein [Nematostella vectensis]|uniref:Serine/threonine-protein phosphatase 2A activator n=1 Tax=Nematostella vectensis TaxID=45351 RepID=A7T1C8_NEMVE|nr:predicted protein [Nematostella vectensis]|eukprot:XP_001622340.1 hypothetical protein NEMVEDRAFT_v1g220857 [Nematostella vectensis]
MAASEESKVAFVEPKREIFQPQDVAKWESSQAYHDLVEFILLLGEAVKNKKTRVELNISEPLATNKGSISKMAASEEYKVAFVEPKREIFQPQDVAKWESSQAYHDLVEFILLLGEAVKNKKTRVELNISENCLKLIEVLDTMDKWIEEIPPVEQPQRFGNKAFRDWFDKMEEVLSKFPVIQHFVFGNLMSIEPAECFNKPPQPQ